MSAPDGGSRAIVGQPGVWTGDHLEIPGHGVTAKPTANGRPQKPYKLRKTLLGPSIRDGQEQEKSSENTGLRLAAKQARACKLLVVYLEP